MEITYYLFWNCFILSDWLLINTWLLNRWGNYLPVNKLPVIIHSMLHPHNMFYVLFLKPNKDKLTREVNYLTESTFVMRTRNIWVFRSDNFKLDDISVNLFGRTTRCIHPVSLNVQHNLSIILVQLMFCLFIRIQPLDINTLVIILMQNPISFQIWMLLR